jgi:hypothetical protein
MKNPKRAPVDWPAMMALCHELYLQSCVGGNLHIALDDGNLGDDDLQFCLDLCLKEGDGLGEEIARKMLAMSPYQRKKLYVKVDRADW